MNFNDEQKRHIKVLENSYTNKYSNFLPFFCCCMLSPSPAIVHCNSKSSLSKIISIPLTTFPLPFNYSQLRGYWFSKALTTMQNTHLSASKTTTKIILVKGFHVVRWLFNVAFNNEMNAEQCKEPRMGKQLFNKFREWQRFMDLSSELDLKNCFFITMWLFNYYSLYMRVCVLNTISWPFISPRILKCVCVSFIGYQRILFHS